MQVQLATTPEQINACKEVIFALRPHLVASEFLELLQTMQTQGYHLAYIEEKGKAVAAVGYRYLQFLFNGKHIYIDDLSTLPEHRGKGYATTLLNFVKAEAKARGLNTVTLDSGHHRHAAHRLYLNQGFIIGSHHFSCEI
jgi:GNAT superfamily N-acetyltransferase